MTAETHARTLKLLAKSKDEELKRAAATAIHRIQTE